GRTRRGGGPGARRARRSGRDGGDDGLRAPGDAAHGTGGEQRAGRGRRAADGVRARRRAGGGPSLPGRALGARHPDGRPARWGRADGCPRRVGHGAALRADVGWRRGALRRARDRAAAVGLGTVGTCDRPPAQGRPRRRDGCRVRAVGVV
ncbi:MAG: hypothetical protein AVDCRST_MAG79-2622, partial [uncultured Thermoleophilia bacterium]